MEKEEVLYRLGIHIRKLREGKNLSQKDLAIAIGKDQQSIQRLETGKINPSFYYLYEIAEGLKITMPELLDFHPGKSK